MDAGTRHLKVNPCDGAVTAMSPHALDTHISNAEIKVIQRVLVAERAISASTNNLGGKWIKLSVFLLPSENSTSVEYSEGTNGSFRVL